MDLESLRGCITGSIHGTADAIEAVEQLARPSLYNRKNPPKF